MLVSNYFCTRVSWLLNFDTDDVVLFDTKYFFPKLVNAQSVDTCPLPMHINMTSRICLIFYFIFLIFGIETDFCLVLDSKVQEISLRCNWLIATNQFYITECEVHKYV